MPSKNLRKELRELRFRTVRPKSIVQQACDGRGFQQGKTETRRPTSFAAISSRSSGVLPIRAQKTLGVDEASLSTFPEEFRQGMVARRVSKCKEFVSS